MVDTETPGAPDVSPSSAEPALPLTRPRRFRARNFLPWLFSLLMLVIGVFIGYLGRPFITPESSGTSVTADGRPALLDLLISQTRHFKGKANAPVTVLEFSDFQ